MSSGTVRVVVVEGSAARRTQLVAALEADGDIKVVGDATSVADAFDVVGRWRPDVVTVDLLSPEGGGQLLIEQIMAATPTPILVLSANLADESSSTAAKALAGGALVALAKPASWTETQGAQLRRTVRNLKGAVVIRHPRGRLRTRPTRDSGPSNGTSVVAVAASTGGPAALATVLAGLADVAAPVLVVQHLHPDYVESFATWMRRVSALPVVVAEDKQLARPGHVYIAPGGVHLRLGRESRIELSATPESVHRPSADELFGSVAENAGARGIGVILTGIGDDGAQGLLALARAGGRTLGQDELSSAVFGMPRAAGGLGAVEQFLDPAGIARAVCRLTREQQP